MTARPSADQRGRLQSLGVVLLGIPVVANGVVVVALLALAQEHEVDNDTLWIAAYVPSLVAVLLAAVTVGLDPTRSIQVRVGLCLLAAVLTLLLAVGVTFVLFLVACSSGCTS